MKITKLIYIRAKNRANIKIVFTDFFILLPRRHNKSGTDVSKARIKVWEVQIMTNF